MNERELVIAICRDLQLPTDQYIINGSGAMIMQGITARERGKPMGDLDVFCATRRWFELIDGTITVMSVGAQSPSSVPTKVHWQVYTPSPANPLERVDPPYLYATMYGLEVNIFHSWRRRPKGNFDVAFYIANAKVVDGVPCVPLQWILDWKCEVGRAKDQIDIEVLRRYV